MAKFRIRLQLMTSLVALLLLSGCPLFAPSPKIAVSPTAINFSAKQSVRTLTIMNEGGGSLSWSIEEVARDDEFSPWVTEEVSWLSAASTSGTTTTKNTLVEVNVVRTGLEPGIITNAGLRVLSNGGEVIVPVSMVIETTLFPSTSLIPLEIGDNSLEFQIINTGNNTSNWQLFFLPDSNNPDFETPFPLDFSITPGTVGSTLPQRSTTVRMEWVNELEDFGVLVVSEDGIFTVFVRFDTIIQGVTITPDPLVLFVSSDPSTTTQPTSLLTIANSGLATRNFTVSLVLLNTSSTSAPINFTPTTLSVGPNTEQTVAFQVTDAETILLGSGNYEVVVRSGDELTRIPVVVELTELPLIAISEPPDPEVARPEVVPLSVLDFGTSSFQETFYVVNLGPPGSQLFFTVTEVTNEEGEVVDTETLPVILDIDPSQGDTNADEGDFFVIGTNRFIDGQPVTVTIDRSALTQDVTFINLEISATDPSFSTVNTAVESRTVQVRIQQPPLTVEGALNRSRPPFMGRWVLLVRDRFGNALPADTAEDFERLDFRLFENGTPLDENETNKFIGKPRNFNLGIILDYTASLYNAGTTNTTNPLERGEATQNMIESTKELIRDLPPNTRIGLFYQHDRSQQNFVMHQFTTDKNALITRLEEFTVPNALYGSSKINDSLIAAISSVVAEDPADALPFDETDVRAVLFVTDGNDNSSAVTESTVIELARSTGVRLYPVTYDPGSNGPNTAELVEMASETGGHFYNAGKDVLNLSKILSNAGGMTLETTVSGTTSDKITFRLGNPTLQPMSYAISFGSDANWIQRIQPSAGQLPSGSSQNVIVDVDPTQVVPGTTVETTLNISTNLGKGKVLVNLATTPQGGVANLSLTLIDQPGRFWDDLQNQFMLTYNTPRQQNFDYDIEVLYTLDNDEIISGTFTEDSLFYIGDPLGGQISLVTQGINSQNQVEVFVRADFVPRNVNIFRMRFYTQLPEGAPQAAITEFPDIVTTVELADEDGLLLPDDPNAQPWAIVNEGDGIYLLVTNQENPLPFSSFGNLLKITFSNMEDFIGAYDGIPQQPEFTLEMRVDNNIYVSPASPTQPADSKYFLYPSGLLNPERPLIISTRPDIAGPSQNLLLLNQFVILNPESPFAFNVDEDALPDFNDPSPFNEDLPSRVSQPNPLDIDGNVNAASILITNNRLDTFTFEITNVPSWIIFNDTPTGTLAPGTQITLNIVIDRTGLAPGVYREDLGIILGPDLFLEDENIQVTMVVPAQP